MKLFIFLLGGLIAPLLLMAESQTIEGYFNDGGEDVYTQGNEHYCIVPVDDTTVKFTLDLEEDGLESCVYLTLGSVKESECDVDPILEINNIPGRMYKIVIAPVVPADNKKFTLTAEYEDGGIFGRCTDYYYAGYLNMDISSVNFILASMGLLTAIIFYGVVTYVVVTLGNF